jgi:hypothetical protein
MDPTPQPHLYLEDGTPERSPHAVDANQLYDVLASGNVPLVVLSACASAAASPDSDELPMTASASLAQTLMERPGGPSAVIAMQFEFEAKAAQIFSSEFYKKLLQPKCCLDEAVAFARGTLSGRFEPGHRAWVTPTVYWRCKDGRLFEFQGVESHLTNDQRNELIDLDSDEQWIMDQLDDLSRQPPEIFTALAGTAEKLRAKMVQLHEERRRILGTTLDLQGGPAEPDGSIKCALLLQLQSPSRIGDVRTSVPEETDDFLLLDYGPGQNVAEDSVFRQKRRGNKASILIKDASRGGEWSPGSCQLAWLQFRFKNPSAKPIFHVRMSDSSIVVNGADQPIKTLDAVVFGTNRAA